MNGIYYFPIFIYTMSAFAVLYSGQYLSSGNDAIFNKQARTFVPALIICVILIFWMGMRPISGIFGDTVSYYTTYMKLGSGDVKMDWSKEWLWSWLMQLCHDIGLNVNQYFTVIEFGYISTIFAAVCILMPRNPLLGMLFVFVSFSFFTFGVNGLRNGLAVHIVMLGIALYLSDKRSWAALLFVMAFGFHRSTILPLACFFAALYVVKNPKYAIYIWLASVPLSLVSGYFFVNIFAGLGFDDRVSQYLTVSEGHALQEATSAFRWDFLLYSSMPVLMAYTTIVKRGITDNWYNIIATTYCLSNTFWVLVIRASFSNRFAYLSWFIYPIAIAYPLIMLPVWPDQDNKTGSILVAYAVLTLAICFFTGMI